ncbi:metallophosphoesterase family protein [Massilia sp. PWRC2]|uniref:metallophosphoesterase family protein n=1 Tax=Massilia sp. PWRC2 TaxID=2804626 RepID=UPI003CE773E0
MTVLLCLTGCSTFSAIAPPVEEAYLLRGAGSTLLARALVAGTRCPAMEVDGASLPMQLRVAAAEVAARPVAQGLTKPARFPLSVCEATLPAAARSARVGSIALAVPQHAAERIVIVGDTGCRLKQSDGAFQPCLDSAAWPFAQISRSAAALKPDLVIHVGDVHYRESPCPPGQASCAGSAWGFGQDAWSADLFEPARPLLRAAPWVFVRGNHESCARAGQGWFRFLDAAPWTAQRSCDLARDDAQAAHSAPFAIAVDAHTQLIVFDSSEQDDAAAAFQREFAQINALARPGVQSIFLSHHPLFGLGLPGKHKAIGPSSKTMLSALAASNADGLLPSSVTLALHGHVHLFEALGFEAGGTPTFVLGNSGTLADRGLPEQLPEAALQLGAARIAAFYTQAGHGFALLERQQAGWQLTEYARDGRASLVCAVQGASLSCAATTP